MNGDVSESVKEALKEDYEKIVEQLQKNVLLNTALISFCLGCVAMLAGGVSWYAYAVTDSVHWFTFGVYVIVVHVLFHMCEFCVAAVVRPREAHPDSFMIFHSVHYWIANGLALAEFFVEVFLIPDSMKLSKDSGLFSLLFRLNYTSCVCFALLTVIFYAVRVVAMIQGGSNFGLSIEDEKREEHTLVKHGVYKYLRHPAYFGWFWRTALAQLIIANPVNFVLHTLVTWYFFKRRIRYEEALLLKEDYFGDEYKFVIVYSVAEFSSVVSESLSVDISPLFLSQSLLYKMLFKYLLSLHLFPAVSSAVVCAAGTFYGGLSHKAGLSLFAFGCVASAAVFFVSPILTLRAAGGMYGVGIRQLPARSGAPPLTVFYPLPNKSDKKMPWLPFSDLGFLRGMARYVKLPPFLLYDMQFTTVVAEQDAKGTLYSKNDKPHQLILFSHGLGGYGRLYSVLLMNLASRGAIVVAVDHMDASAAFCRDETNSFRIELDTTKKWERADREPQLVQRVKELQETLRRFSQTNEVFEAVCGSAKDAEVFRNKQYGVALVGHSFGGASVLATALAEETAAHGKVSAVVGLDPWHIPLDGPLFAEPIEKGTKKYTTPTLLFHSQSWYVWPESWDFFEKLEKTVKAQTFTSAEKEKLAEATNKTHTAMLESWYNQQKTAGTGHLSYTDMSVLSPVIFRKPYMTAKAKPQLIDWSNAVLKFAVLQSNPLPLPPPPPKGWPNPN